jgi:hypothetical protein
MVGIVDAEETAVARRRDSKHLCVVTNADATVELLGHCLATRFFLCGPWQGYIKEIKTRK